MANGWLSTTDNQPSTQSCMFMSPAVAAKTLETGPAGPEPLRLTTTLNSVAGVVVSSVRYSRRSPPVLGPSGGPVLDDCHMSKPNPRKRQRTEQCPLQLNGTSQPQPKRQKPSHRPHRSQPPAAFWENLSKIWLTKGALRELDRRNSQPASRPPRSPYRRARRSVTRSSLSELKRNLRVTQSAADFLRNCDLKTLKDIQIFARYGGPDLSDLRGFPEPADPLDQTMSSSHSSSWSRRRGSISTASTRPTSNITTTKTASTGPYDRNFQQILIDSGVYPHGYRYPGGRVPTKPNNWDEINQRLTQPRPSLSPSKFSEEAHERFVQADANASKEKQVSELVIPTIEGEVEDTRMRSGGISLGNLAPLTDGTLKPGNPDLYYGACPEQLNRRVREELSGHIVPSAQDSLPVVPNFFLEAKGPDGSLAIAGRQACYDGALGARGMHSLQLYGQDEPVHDNNAYTITSTYHGGQLKMYTSHPTRPNGLGTRPEYYMHQINTWGMTGNPGTFRQGATAFRNARDWVEEQRNAAIARANERVRETIEDEEAEETEVEEAEEADDEEVEAGSSSTLLSFAYGTTEPTLSTLIEDQEHDLYESETSIDELAVDVKSHLPPAKRSSSKSHRYRRRKRRTC